MYDIRHLFASVMLAGGADLAAVSILMGHSSTQMTANVYYELLEGEKKRAISLLLSLYEVEKKPEKVIPIRVKVRSVIHRCYPVVLAKA